MIFGCRTLEQLVKTMCPSGKAHIVNLTYLLRGPSEGGRTIEFRQHEGCLDVEGVRWWVAVCVGLVRAAERMAGEFGCEAVDEWGLVGDEGKGGWRSRASEYDGRGYKTKEWREGIEVEEVWDLIALVPQGRAYFAERARRFRDG